VYYVFGKEREQKKKMRGISHIKHYCSLLLRAYCLISMPAKSIHLLCYVHKFTEITRVNRQDNTNFPLYFLRGKIHWLLFSVQSLWINLNSICNAVNTITYLCYRSFIYNVRRFLQKSCQRIDNVLFVPWLLWITENPQYIFQFNQEMVLFNWVKQVLNSGKFEY